MVDLKEFLPEKLKVGLTPAEEKVLQTVQEGIVADFRVGNPEIDNPEKAENWGPERTISSEFLYWIYTDREISPYIHARF